MEERIAALTGLLERAAAGDQSAADNLLEQIYPTLRKLARKQLSAHQKGTLCTTDLVHEAYFRLFGLRDVNRMSDCGHLFSAAAQAMRHILVDHARRRLAVKRGGDWCRVSLDESQLAMASISGQVLALEESLTKLKQIDARCHQVVELRFFAGCSIEEVANHLRVSNMTVKRDWRKARAFIYADMGGEQ